MSSDEGFFEDTIDLYAPIKHDTEWGVFKIGEKPPVVRGMTRSQAAARADELNRANGYPLEDRRV